MTVLFICITVPIVIFIIINFNREDQYRHDVQKAYDYKCLFTLPCGKEVFVVDKCLIEDFARFLKKEMKMSNNAQFLGATDFPNQVELGETFSFDLQFRNTGTETWFATGTNKHQLGSRNPDNNTVWGSTSRFTLSGNVAVGDVGTFNLEITAPMSSGFKSCQWGLVKEGVEWFGEKFVPTIHVGDTPVSLSDVQLPNPYVGGGAVSAVVCLTPQYRMDGTTRIFRWVNNKGIPLEIFGIDMWVGVQSTGNKCDVHTEVRRMNDGSILGKLQFDRYSETNYFTNKYVGFSEPFVLQPDDAIDLFTHGTDLNNIDSGLVSQHSVEIFVKEYILPE